MVENYKKQKYEDKKNLIISVAEKFFSRFGLNKTTMDEIAKSARIGKATLYHYFGSKEHIFAEVIQKESQILKNRLNEAIETSNNPKEQIRTYIITRMNYLNSLANTYSALTDEYLEHYACVKKFRHDFNNYEMQTLASILRYGVDQNVFSNINVNDVAKVISIALRGLEIPLLTEEKSENFEDDINLMTDTMLYGICK